MRKPYSIKNAAIAAMLFIAGGANAQLEQIEQVGRLIDDALFYSDKYITPATDGAIYQAASGWMASAKKRDFLHFDVSLNTNVFFVPQSDRSFIINNSDFKFFTLTDGTSATVPTALGNDEQVNLTGQLGDEEVKLKTPEGINREAVVYPYLQGAIGIGAGFEIVGKYSPKVKLKRSNYQVYGIGLKHSIGHYLGWFQRKNINLAVLAAYSKEDVTFDFLNVDTSAGTLGIDSLNGLVDTWQFQANASKEFGNFEIMGGFIMNTSAVEYKVAGQRGSIEDIIPLQQILNTRLETIAKSRTNYIGEASVKYNLGHFGLQGIFAFGKFANTNFSVHYQF